MRRCGGPCGRELAESEFVRHWQLKRGLKTQAMCQRCQIENEIKKAKARLDSLEASWQAIHANAIRSDKVKAAFEQSRLMQAGERM